MVRLALQVLRRVLELQRRQLLELHRRHQALRDLLQVLAAEQSFVANVALLSAHPRPNSAVNVAQSVADFVVLWFFLFYFIFSLIGAYFRTQEHLD